MPKVKTNSGAKKRFKVTGKGKIMRHQSFHNHLLNHKTKKRKLRLSKQIQLHKNNETAIKKLLNLKG